MAASLLQVSLRQQAVYIPPAARSTDDALDAAVLVANLARLGFGVSEPLLRALRGTTPAFQTELLTCFREIMGVQRNWTPLVRGWQVPTGESVLDHLLTFFANAFPSPGTRLPCGHLIPPDTFPLARYNGCPFCGTPFQFDELPLPAQGSKLKVLDLWTEADLHALLRDLLAAKTPLDATQVDSLKGLLAVLPLPADPVIGMKETRMAVIDALVEQERPAEVQVLFGSPTDVLRYLWYRHTGFLQLVQPRVVQQRQRRNAGHVWPPLSRSAEAQAQARQALKLKYSRRQAAMVADWLNQLPLSPRQMAEQMHPRRGMWVRFIRALRLAEYARRPGREKLRELLDVFYRQDYPVWQGRVEHCRLRHDAPEALRLLRQRPGLFARSLFATMLWFGPDEVLAAFREVIDQVPARLLLALGMYAETYFEPELPRSVRPLGGVPRTVPANAQLGRYDEPQRAAMRAAVAELYRRTLHRRFAAQAGAPGRRIYIAPALFYLPVPVGDRSENLQDLPVALMGTRFAVQGPAVRLFMQWGQGLPAQHLDMDLSCQIAYPERTEFCSFGWLAPTGCRHSGDVQYIPEQVGTAEYIELDLDVLSRAGARYVSFTCNAYTHGNLAPNLVVGWMDSHFPMQVAPSGVAYDPSCVQHQVRISQGLTKGLVFGVLDVARREIVWLEMPFQGQLVQQLSLHGVEALLRRLDSKLSIGQLLTLKAEAQQLTIVDAPEAADEAYSAEWARNAAAVTQLLVD
jgi:hypothetical protein